MSPPEGPSAVCVDGLGFTYPGAHHPAIQGMSFTIERGEVFGFLGPSGAGKSTTQKILIKLLTGWTGQVEVFGRPLLDWGPDFYAEIGVSFELPNHYLKLTARENLDYFASLYRGREVESADTVLDWVGLGDAADQRVDAFSKGMKNRLNLARSLLHRPRLLFLDEPTSGLDPVSARRVRELVQERRKAGVTTFLTTHDMHTADVLCDRVGFVVDGRLDVVDAPRALRLRHGRREVELTYRVGEAEQRQRFPLDGLGDNSTFTELLRSVRVETLHTLETSLEDVFVEVTGKSLS